MKAWPTPPTPAGSVVPRANTISTSEHGAAVAVGMPSNAIGDAHAIAATAPRTRAVIIVGEAIQHAVKNE
jgi:hypothetical protein